MNAILENSTVQSARRKSQRGMWPPQRWPRSFFLVVIFPTILSGIYYGFIASPRYVSEAALVIEAEDKSATATALASALSALGALSGGSALGQAQLLAEFITSQSMLTQVQNLIDIKSMYSNPEADWFSRLKRNATQEEFLDYFKSSVEVELDTTSHILTIRAEAFRPDEAKLIVQTILIVSEETLNKMLLRKQNDTLDFARQEVRKAEARLSAARSAVSEFRRNNADIDPTRSAAAQGSLIANLSAQLAEARAEFTSSLAFLRADSTQIKALRARIDALQQQIAAEEQRLASGDDGTINVRLSKYEELLFEQEFAQAAYTSALTFLDTARLTSQRQRNYVIDFVEPNLPEEAIKPERFKAIALTAVVGTLVWVIGSLLLGAIRENSSV
jgi:capsular polysaccharide transport system permease protein